MASNTPQFDHLLQNPVIGDIPNIAQAGTVIVQQDGGVEAVFDNPGHDGEIQAGHTANTINTGGTGIDHLFLTGPANPGLNFIFDSLKPKPPSADANSDSDHLPAPSMPSSSVQHEKPKDPRKKVRRRSGSRPKSAKALGKARAPTPEPDDRPSKRNKTTKAQTAATAADNENIISASLNIGPPPESFTASLHQVPKPIEISFPTIFNQPTVDELKRIEELPEDGPYTLAQDTAEYAHMESMLFEKLLGGSMVSLFNVSWSATESPFLHDRMQGLREKHQRVLWRAVQNTEVLIVIQFCHNFDAEIGNVIKKCYPTLTPLWNKPAELAQEIDRLLQTGGYMHTFIEGPEQVEHAHINARKIIDMLIQDNFDVKPRHLQIPSTNPGVASYHDLKGSIMRDENDLTLFATHLSHPGLAEITKRLFSACFKTPLGGLMKPEMKLRPSIYAVTAPAIASHLLNWSTGYFKETQRTKEHIDHIDLLHKRLLIYTSFIEETDEGPRLMAQLNEAFSARWQNKPSTNHLLTSQLLSTHPVILDFPGAHLSMLYKMVECADWVGNELTF
ncbi:hypothetical protein Hypma_009850 [Hypsizygus marmoreus]|uniref:Uncharacterized protein n=1 Tax=Hypsizygus marmoreus TaxID=39966 RepID=A0A369JRN5_HYPMA|nr:hypothetical protein Hypma_009850 [Hypsizygus marmoreus]